MLRLVLALALSAVESAAPGWWWEGDHLTGDWGGARSGLAARGVTVDLVYALEVFNATALPEGGGLAVLGHLDLVVGLDTGKLGWWPGGRFGFLAQNSHGTGVNTFVGSVTSISNIEAEPYTQLTEFFYEHAFLDGALRVRLGKQDANRDFGTPRFGGNFLNNTQGMIPTVPLPTYPTAGLGAVVIAQPLDWLTLKAGVYEGSPRLDSWGFDSAFAPGAGWMAVAAAAVSHHLGPEGRSGGITSAGVWGQAGAFADLGSDLPVPPTFGSNLGFFIQDDERLFAHPEVADDPSGLTVITRLGWAQPDRNQIPLYVGASVAWHGLGVRADDTVGVGLGWLAVTRQVHGAPGRGSEVSVEVFYKWRLSHFLSLQPDLQCYLHPGGDGRDALLAGARLKLKL